MPRFQDDLIRHIRSVNAWITKTGAVGGIDLDTLIVGIRHGGKAFQLYPQFLNRAEDGSLGYTLRMRPGTIGFVGWYSYERKHWPIARDKNAFKGYLEECGLPTPPAATCLSKVNRAYLIKPVSSSFGVGIRGPYRPDEHALPEVSLRPGEYYEELVLGRIARAWYCKSTLAVLELFPMPTVIGDGLRSLKTLVRDKIGEGTDMPDNLDRIAHVQGLFEDDVVPSGVECIADYRYVSPLNNLGMANYNVLPATRDSAVVRQFKEAGPLFYDGIPATSKQDTVFVIDAIVDRDDKAWFLEMNCNSQQHPDVYDIMLGGLCGD